ncbi:MAG: DNA topoisomerase (ATP-hydrolyzing) subunit A [Treponema porcinum]|uniref:DNA topoisomerase (ATP-hydrolyzing) subunit A n=2 Tax=Treponema porcinum TaxID=261392 RepID=UPI002355E311|nr:DNA topoisomerase (ATP-hydrolyzing) subunit A [Treponema porcinum]MDY4153198.1 DNA topoisomerase (ATP-hydrolyzing) subunit A [Treponema sp.]MCI6179987.1 DNA topoisomerase (ATP-hydrolyzing) subunit A [Treponema porcinum]MCI6322284.1 DNA topoisomerase (ATP-hydrolyzing) subunit A [Treponema porcinum]MCI6721478.1 DNA topoisomerase (ATP-hydrolyzing) subunit A [Treponema porcinum]MCI6815821.1 DNA topoisomerase (ATP-hydrolyzing) subunit A [Treponema porcinum]
MEEITTPEGGKVIKISIEDEVKQAYIDYSMSVIVQRALPDVRDGLKPVHRRIMYAMDTLHLASSGKTKKCATIVGEVLGHYHPHGDASVYDALVRLGQDFSQRYTTVTPQGNFGTIAGDPPAAYRYTEAKMSKITEEMVADISKETVDMIPNFDDSTKEPSVLPSKFPFLLCNGTTGIAVGMATNMPTHNLREVSAAICAYIENNDISIEQLMTHIKGPDFPTGGIIYGKDGIKKAYSTGRGKITIRSKFSIETDKHGRESIVFTEVPYGVNTTNIIRRIKELIRDKQIDGIVNANDESSDRSGMRLVVDLKKGAITKLVLNQLFAKTDLQSNFGVINLALVPVKKDNGMRYLKPEVLTLKQLIQYFVSHRDEVITRRTQYDLKIAQHRMHILEALITAINNIDEVIKIIKASRDTEDAKNQLEARFSFDDEQAQAIVDMQLKRLTHLQIEDLQKEIRELQAYIDYLKDLLEHHEKILDLIKKETNEMAEKYGDDRRTDIVADEVEEINVEDMIKEEDMVVMISKLGYMKRVSVSAYKKQGRGGTGSNSTALLEDDYISQLFIGSTHDYILFVTNAGRAYWIKVHEIPESSKNSRGTHIKSMIAIGADEEITTVVTLREFSDTQYLFMTTSNGIVKKVQTSEFANAKTRGIIGLKLKDGDKLISAIPTDGKSEVLLVTRRGKALRFSENTVREMGRASCGIRGMKLSEGDEISGAIQVKEGETILLLTEKGYGKRVRFEDFNPHGRGTGGQKIFGKTEERGEIIGLLTVKDDDEVVCMTSQGKTLRVLANTINQQGTGSTGVKVVKISEPDFLVGIDKVPGEDNKE